MKSIKERLQSLLDKKEYSIKEIDSAVKGIVFTPPIESIITYNYLHQKKEKKQKNLSSENKEWKKLSCDKKYKIEEKFQKEYKEFDKNALLIEKYLILDYHKKYFTVEDFYVSQNIRKAKIEGKPIDRARVEGEISWSLMSYQEKEEWEKLAKENEIFWLVNNNMFHNRKSSYIPSTSIKKKKPKLFDRTKKKEFFNNLRQYNLSKYQELAVWSLIHKTSLTKNSIKNIFREWYKGYAIYDKISCKKREIYFEEKMTTLSKEEKKEFELFFKKFNLIQKYTNYMIKHHDNFEIRQKFTPYYFFYLDYKDKLETISGGVLEKVKFLENKWNSLTEKEKKKFQLKMFDFLYNESNYFNYFSTKSTEKIESQSTNILSDTQSIFDDNYEEISEEDENLTNNSYFKPKETNTKKINMKKPKKSFYNNPENNKTSFNKNKKVIEKIIVITEDNPQNRKEECNLYIRNNFQKYKETFPKLTKNEIISMLFFQWKRKKNKEDENENEKEKYFIKQKNLSIKKRPLINNFPSFKKTFEF